uniref:Uncharacterized protein n=1 Tax=Arundo donax TaxID=35708 RepID=A0A0A9ERI0_ARUDO
MCIALFHHVLDVLFHMLSACLNY